MTQPVTITEPVIVCPGCHKLALATQYKEHMESNHEKGLWTPPAQSQASPPPGAYPPSQLGYNPYPPPPKRPSWISNLKSLLRNEKMDPRDHNNALLIWSVVMLVIGYAIREWIH